MRSVWKIPYLIINSSIINQERPVIYKRSTTITPNLIGITVSIHNGNRLVNVAITENHVGYKFGQFAFTKKRVFHKKKKLKK